MIEGKPFTPTLGQRSASDRSSAWVHRKGWLQRLYTFLLKKVIYPLLLRLEVEGMERIPGKGPAILAMNHISFLDPVLMVSLPERKVVAMAKAENMAHPILGRLSRAFDAFPVRRGEVDRRALRTAMEVLQAGGLLLIAPEGTRSPTGQLQQGRDGLAFIATRARVPIVPVGIDGSDRFKVNIRRLRRTPVRVVFGEPFSLETEGRADRAALARMTDEVMRHIARLLPPERRGVYRDSLERLSAPDTPGAEKRP